MAQPVDRVGEIAVLDLGRMAYEPVYRLQRRLAAQRRDGAIGDVLLMVEHDRVYTAGRHANVAAHVLGRPGIPLVHTDRGGDVTYHGPGQLVAYPIVRLAQRVAVRPYVEALQAACIATAAHFGVAGRPDPDRTGVWVGEEKLAAIGVRVDGGVTTHGLALNVTTDLADFAGIVPCGIRDAGVCSLRSLGVTADVEDVRPVLVRALAAALRRTIVDADAATLGVPLLSSGHGNP